jgi:hypothetical protein
VPAPPRLARRRTEPRLDPIRWRRPGRGTLVRLIAVAVLLALGATPEMRPTAACGRVASDARTERHRLRPRLRSLRPPLPEGRVGRVAR